jgi:hypothetical protein
LLPLSNLVQAHFPFDSVLVSSAHRRLPIDAAKVVRASGDDEVQSDNNKN